MSHRLDYYFRQRVSEAELDLGFSQLEQADRDLAADLGFTGVIANAVVSQHAPVPDLTVDISAPGAVTDQLGQRIFFSALQNVNVAQDDNGVSTGVSGAGKEKIVSVFAKFDRALSDPRVDGNSLTVFFRRDESFKFIVVQGAEASAGGAIPPPLRSDAILLADLTRSFGQTQVLNANLSIARRQDAFVASASPRSIRRGRTLEAVTDLLAFYNAHVNGTADRHPAAAVDYAGGGAWADGGTNPATTVEAQLDKLVADLTATSGAPKVGAAATAGSPNALAAGTVKSQLDALLAAVNAHINLASGAHAASATSYAGGGNWADGTTNPATTVEAQLDKVITDLAGAGGADKLGATVASLWADATGVAATRVKTALDEIVSDLAAASGAPKVGAAATAGAPNALAAGSVKSQLDAVLGFLNSHVNNASGAHAASAVSYAGGGNWADGTTNPATTVEAQLDKLVADLVAAAGAARIGAAAAGSIPAGTVRSQLDFVMANAGASPNAANTWSALQTMNGAAGDTNGALATTAAPTTRKLLWEFAIGSYKGRLYSSTSFNGAFEVTINARWDGTQWVRDSSSLFSVKWSFHNYEWRIDVKTGTGNFADSAWTGFFNIAFPFGAPNSMTLDVNGQLEGTGTCNSYIAAQAQQAGNGNLGGGAPWKRQFPSTPSSITFATVSTNNVSSGPFSFAASRFGTGAFVSAGASTTTWFYTDVTAS